MSNHTSKAILLRVALSGCGFWRGVRCDAIHLHAGLFCRNLREGWQMRKHIQVFALTTHTYYPVAPNAFIGESLRRYACYYFRNFRPPARGW